MDRETHDQMVGLYWDIRARAEADEEFVRLRQITEELEEKYEVVVRDLPQEHREAIEVYITSRESLNSRLLEITCEKFVQRI